MAATLHGRVYAVLRCTNGCAQIIAVYGSHDRAQAWIDRQDDVPGYSYDIEEHVLDQDYRAEEGE